MKKIFFAVIIISFFGFTAQAQTAAVSQNTVSGENLVAIQQAQTEAQRYAKHYQANLKLNEEQTKKVYEANLTCYKVLFAQKNASGNDWTPLERNAILEKRDAELKNILTADQFSKFIMNKNPKAAIR